MSVGESCTKLAWVAKLKSSEMILHRGENKGTMVRKTEFGLKGSAGNV